MRYRVIKVVIFFLLLWLVTGFYGAKGELPLTKAITNELAEEYKGALYAQFMPGLAGGARESCIAWAVETQVETVLPLYGMVRRNVGYSVETAMQVPIEVGYMESNSTETNSMENSSAENPYIGNLSMVWEDDGHSKVLAYEELMAGDLQYLPTEQELQALMREENQAAQSYVTEFVPHSRQTQLRLEDYANYEDLVSKFYTIDTNTMAGSDQLNLQTLLSRDMTLQTQGEGPQILIYHTHSQEQFADSVAGDESTSIVGVGEHLAEILREQYGYRVLHHTGQYDVDTRDDAYGKALPALEELLAAYPSIQVVIDLHRDAMAEENRLVMDLDGRPTARFMFFNGLSRTKNSGNISYLENKNISDNLAFSFQMKLKCEEYYPGLTRKIYLKGYRYNMHLRPRSLLVELGAQNNTVEEVMNACDPLAHVLDMVLSGEV